MKLFETKARDFKASMVEELKKFHAIVQGRRTKPLLVYFTSPFFRVRNEKCEILPTNQFYQLPINLNAETEEVTKELFISSETGSAAAKYAVTNNSMAV